MQLIHTLKRDLGSNDSFERTLLSSDWLKRMPFEHTFRGVPHDQFVRRLLQERGLFTSETLTSIPKVTIVVFPDGDSNKFRRTFESCILQSAPCFRILIVSPDSEILSRTAHECRDRLFQSPFLERDFSGRIFYSDAIYSVIEKPEFSEGYLVSIKSGDVFHPSCIASVYLENRLSSNADVYLWNEMHLVFGADVKVERFLRKPLFEPYTLFHFNYVGYSFAFRSAFASYLADSYLWLDRDDAHFFLLSILGNKGSNFVTIPQYLLLRDIDHVRTQSYVSGPLLHAYQQYFSSLGFTLRLGDGFPGYSLVPQNVAKTITVIIPFRDKAELTCRAVEFVVNQDTECWIEIILINNQSKSQSLESVIRFTTSVVSQKRIIRFIDYDRPFNHSAECNLGANEAEGECLVFLNNDVEFISPKALEEMAAWSLVPGVGTVGIQMLLDPNGKTAAAGIRARLAGGKDFNSPVEESMDSEFGCYNRQTWGNSFACAAISRKTFDSVGPLDEINFPNGYNDVDYNMRCRKANLANIYLGTLRALHRPGTSRGRYDEIYQKVLLRRKFPEILGDGLFQLMLEDRLPCPDHSFRSPEPSGSYLHRFAKKISRWVCFLKG